MFVKPGAIRLMTFPVPEGCETRHTRSHNKTRGGFTRTMGYLHFPVLHETCSTELEQATKRPVSLTNLTVYPKLINIFEKLVRQQSSLVLKLGGNVKKASKRTYPCQFSSCNIKRSPNLFRSPFLSPLTFRRTSNCFPDITDEDIPFRQFLPSAAGHLRMTLFWQPSRELSPPLIYLINNKDWIALLMKPECFWQLLISTHIHNTQVECVPSGLKIYRPL